MSVNFRLLDFHNTKYLCIWLPNSLTLRIPDESLVRKASCVLHYYIYGFFLNCIYIARKMMLQTWILFQYVDITSILDIMINTKFIVNPKNKNNYIANEGWTYSSPVSE